MARSWKSSSEFPARTLSTEKLSGGERAIAIVAASNEVSLEVGVRRGVTSSDYLGVVIIEVITAAMSISALIEVGEVVHEP